MIRTLLCTAVFAVAGSFAARADEFRPITDRTSFVSLVQGKQLTRLGIRLDVLETGAILGKAFGKPVTGAWRWQNGLFCRDLYFGQQDLGPNCQVVKLRGDTLRFIADRGNGQYSDLSLR